MKKRKTKPTQGYSIRITNTRTGEGLSECVYRKTGTKVSAVLRDAVKGANKTS